MGGAVGASPVTSATRTPHTARDDAKGLES